jgi:hypothetical protein
VVEVIANLFEDAFFFSFKLGIQRPQQTQLLMPDNSIRFVGFDCFDRKNYVEVDWGDLNPRLPRRQRGDHS